MKKVLFSAALLTALVGCQTSESFVGDMSSASSYEELTFNPSGNKMTKAAVDKDATEFNDDGDDIITDDFGVIIFVTEDDWSDALDGATTNGTTTDYSTVADITNQEGVTEFISNAYGKVEYQTTGDFIAPAWRISGSSIWPINKSLKANVYAYTPHSTTTGEYPTEFNENSMVILDYDNTDADVNLMTAMAFDNIRELSDEGYVKSGSEIALNFYRALSQLRFNISLFDVTASGLDNEDNTTEMIAIDDIKEVDDEGNEIGTGKFDVYAEAITNDLYFPKAKASIDDAKVYTAADVYLQEIKVCNIPTKGDCTVTIDDTYSTMWETDGTKKEYIIYQNTNYTGASSYDTYKENGVYNGLNETNDADFLAALQKGKLLTTLVEGDQAIDNMDKGEGDYGYDADDVTAGDVNPFFRPLVISPFSIYNEDTDAADYDVCGCDITEVDTDTDPYVEFTIFVRCNTNVTTTDGMLKTELAVVRKPLYANLAPNSRVTYNVEIELSDLTFDPEIETVVDLSGTVDISNSADIDEFEEDEDTTTTEI